MLIKKDPELIASYLEDYSNIKGGFCNAVIIPGTEQQVCDILRSASAEGRAITVTAAGTGVTGARVPFGGDVLSVERLNKIEKIDRFKTGGGFAVVQAGVVLKEFLENIEAKGLFYPPDPTEKSSFLGGNIGTSASGARSFRFGTIRNYILGLRMVLSDGEILDIERGKIFCNKGAALDLPLMSGGSIKVYVPNYNMPEVKNAAGYYVKDNMDAIDLFIGQEGTLGVITKAKLMLLDACGDTIGCYVFFTQLENALNFIYKARDVSLKNRNNIIKDIDAVSLEFFDKYSLELLRERHGNIPKDAQAAVYFEQFVDEKSESMVMDSWVKLIVESGGSLEKTWFAQSRAEIRKLEEIRHDLPDMVNEFIKRKKQAKVGTDIAVKYCYLDEMIGYYNSLLTEAGLRYVIFGHIGDGHLHVNILPENNKQYDKAREIYTLFVTKAVSLGGTVSAEHGIGKVKHAYLELMYGKGVLKEMALLKKSVDKACILGLDNIFPKELLK